jgi:Uma2 family endonuclease
MMESPEIAMTASGLEMPTRIFPDLCGREFFRMSVEEYEELGAQGILTTNSRVELIEGNLVKKHFQSPAHASTVYRLCEDLTKAAPAGWRARFQLPIRMMDSVPEPDAVFARGDRKTLAGRHPTADEVGLVVEVSDSTLRFDHIIKLPLYARAGIPEYWIVNLVDFTVEVYTEPTFDNGYANRHDYKPSESVPLTLDGVAIASLLVTDLLP